MNVDKSTAQAVIREASEALAPIFAKHGLAAPTINGSYGPELRLTVKAPAVVLDESGVNTASPEAGAYQRLWQTFGFSSPDMLGVEFSTRSGTYRFDGIATSRRKYPIAATRVHGDGCRVYFTTDVVPLIERAANLTRTEAVTS